MKKVTSALLARQRMSVSIGGVAQADTQGVTDTEVVDGLG